MPSFFSGLACAARAVRSGRAHRLAGLDDHLLRDLGVHRTDLYVLPLLHTARMKAACCRLRDVALSLLAGRRSGPCC